MVAPCIDPALQGQALTDLGSTGAKQEQARETLLGQPDAATTLLVGYLANITLKLEERIERLLGQLDSPTWRQREAATGSLERIGIPALPALDRALKSNSPEVAWRARVAATAIRKQDPSEALHAVHRRLAAVQLLAQMARPQSRAVLTHVLDQTNDALLSPIAAIGLGRIGDAAACPALAKSLGHSDWVVRNNVIWALGRIGSPEAVGPLLKLSADPAESRYLRARAIRTLHRLASGNKTHLGAVCRGLAQLLGEDAWEIRAGAVDGLRHLSGKSFGYHYGAQKALRDAKAKAWRDWAAKLPS